MTTEERIADLERRIVAMESSERAKQPVGPVVYGPCPMPEPPANTADLVEFIKQLPILGPREHQ